MGLCAPNTQTYTVGCQQGVDLVPQDPGAAEGLGLLVESHQTEVAPSGLEAFALMSHPWKYK